MGSNEVYFQFKPYYQKQSGQKANLGDFIELSAAEDIKKRIENIPVSLMAQPAGTAYISSNYWFD